jgi:hypothetical protein
LARWLWRLVSLFFGSHRTQTSVDHLSEKSDSSSELRSVRGFLIFGKAAALHQRSKPFNILQQEDRIVDQLFVTIVAEDDRFLFMIPRANSEYAFSGFFLSVHGAAEKSLGDVMMLCRV